MLLSLLQSAPLVFALIAFILLYSLALHELGHAWVADRVGDKTARNLGRVTLNPLKHLDPIGTLLILVVGFGWAKPVPIQPGNFRDYRTGMFLVAIAGVTVNILTAVLCLFALRFLGINLSNVQQIFPQGGTLPNPLAYGLFFAAQINILLAVFNLIPIPPLDGSKVLQAFAPASWQRAMWQVERYGFLIVIALIALFNDQVFSVINRITFWLMRLVLG